MRIVQVVTFLLLGACLTMPSKAQHVPECESDLEMNARQFRTDRIIVRDENAPDRAKLRRWNGPMHRLMRQLEQCVLRAQLTRGELIRLLGDPDLIATSGKRHATVNVPRGEEHLIYWWRGGHDYLFFIIRDGSVADSAWWFAGE